MSRSTYSCKPSIVSNMGNTCDIGQQTLYFATHQELMARIKTRNQSPHPSLTSYPDGVKKVGDFFKRRIGVTP